MSPRSAGSRAATPVARYVLLGTTLLLALGGLVMIYSASHAYDTVRYGDSAYHLKRQVIYLVLGLAAMFLASRVPYERMRRWGWWILIGSDLALVAVLVMGYSSHGAQSWIDLGFTTLQPSEFAKLGCVLTIAALFADRARHPRPIKEDAPVIAAILGPVVLLVMLQPDFGTTVSILVPVFLLMVLGGLERRYITLTVAFAALAIPVAVLMKAERIERITSFLNPWTDSQGGGYQIIQALLAFGSGGVAGLGLGMSRQKYFYLPEAHNDFIFAIIGEELGLVGTLLVVLAFGAFAWAGMRIALSGKDAHGRLMAGGLTLMLVTQAIMNMASVTGVLPVTGLPLPLVSSGGSSMLFTMVCVGLILSVARRDRGRAVTSRRPTGPADEERELAGTSERRRNRRPRLSVIDGGRASARRGA
jgi:cell division protein FtsW